ncbi:Tic22 family protein [Cyanobacterium stanieri PCC 7202]|uniref:Tic22 family protein n=1 Tax=Cyanobacterium stanieri (strain ATCC 29140 / PCC 7202) TaxID=292563 RepID=K9YIL7_CYASC|nr:Tic22 family protein [Cyanobacterium stanieri PCC 7202]
MLKKKSLVNTIRNASIVGATVVSCWLAPMGKLLALPQEVIVEKLQSIPVFTVADEQGAPLVATNGENQNQRVAGVFISKADANNFVQQLRQSNPELGGQVQVIPVSLGEVYEMAEANANQPDGIRFAYVPRQADVEQARRLNSEYRSGVPLFVATAGDDQGYLTVRQGNQEFIPFFFEESQVRELVEGFKQSQPDMADSVQIEVVVLEGMISALEQGDDELLERIMLWPSQESIQFIRENTPQQ